jgi:hypothetical protein
MTLKGARWIGRGPHGRHGEQKMLLTTETSKQRFRAVTFRVLREIRVQIYSISQAATLRPTRLDVRCGMRQRLRRDADVLVVFVISLMKRSFDQYVQYGASKDLVGVPEHCCQRAVRMGGKSARLPAVSGLADDSRIVSAIGRNQYTVQCKAAKAHSSTHNLSLRSASLQLG